MKLLKLFLLIAGITILNGVANAQVIELNENQLFEKVCRGWAANIDYKGDKPCVVLFDNGTCPFAKLEEKFLKTLSKKKEYKGKVYFYKVNVWNLSDQTLKDFSFEGVPQTYFFITQNNHSTSDDYEVGMLSINELKEYLNDMLDY